MRGIGALDMTEKSEGIPSSHWRIAVVDDDDAVRDSLAAVLTSAGHRVLTFSTGEDFLERGLDELPHCVLLDVNLPGADGWTVLEQVRGREAGCAVILVSGRIAPRDHSAATGAFEVLDKPVRASVLLDAIDRALRHN